MSSIGGVGGISPIYSLEDYKLTEQDVVARLQQEETITSGWLQDFRIFLQSQDDTVLTKLHTWRDEKFGVEVRTPLLYLALEFDHPEVVRIILSYAATHGQLVQILDKPEYLCNEVSNFYSPLCMVTDLDTVNLLLNFAGTDINLHVPNQKGICPIINMVLDNWENGVKAILNHPSSQGRIPELLLTSCAFSAACAKGFDGILNVMLDFAARENVDLHVQDPQGARPLARACSLGHCNAVKAILNHPSSQSRIAELLQASNTIAEKTTATALWIACKQGHADVVKLLLDAAGMELDLLSAFTNDTCALSQTIQIGHYEVVSVLLTHPSSKGKIAQMLSSRHNSNKATPFFIACRLGHTKIVNLLLDVAGKDFDLHVPTDHRYPFSIAVMHHNTEVVRVILEHPQSKGRIAQLLQERDGPLRYTPLHTACWRHYADMVTLLLDVAAVEGVNLHVPDKNNIYPIYTAVSYVAGGPLKAILNHHSLKERLPGMLRDANTERDAHTPLHRACQDKTIEIVKMLLAAGAPHDALDRHGNFPHVSAGEDQEICSAFFYHLTGGEGNTHEFFANIAEKLELYTKELKRKNADIDWTDLYHCFQIGKAINFAMMMLPYIPVIPETMVGRRFKKLLRDEYVLSTLQKKLTHMKASMETLTLEESGQQINQLRPLLDFLLQSSLNNPQKGKLVRMLIGQLDKMKELWQLNVNRAKAQKLQQFTSFQNEFDHKDIFVAFSGWNMGMNLTDDVFADPNKAYSSSSVPVDHLDSDRYFTPASTFKVFLGIDKESEIHAARLFEGRDLRALGVDLDINYFVDQWSTQKESPEFVQELVELIHKKRELWDEILGFGAVPLREDWKANLDQPEILQELAEVYKNNGVRLLIHFFEQMKNGQGSVLRNMSSPDQSISEYMVAEGLSTVELYRQLTPSRAKRIEPSSSSSSSSSSKRSRT